MGPRLAGLFYTHARRDGGRDFLAFFPGTLKKGLVAHPDTYAALDCKAARFNS